MSLIMQYHGKRFTFPVRSLFHSKPVFFKVLRYLSLLLDLISILNECSFKKIINCANMYNILNSICQYYNDIFHIGSLTIYII